MNVGFVYPFDFSGVNPSKFPSVTTLKCTKEKKNLNKNGYRMIKFLAMRGQTEHLHPFT